MIFVYVYFLGLFAELARAPFEVAGLSLSRSRTPLSLPLSATQQPFFAVSFLTCLPTLSAAAAAVTIVNYSVSHGNTTKFDGAPVLMTRVAKQAATPDRKGYRRTK